MSRYIDKVGIELEGGWDGTPGISPFDFPLKQDISLHEFPGAIHIGEAASEPLHLEVWEAWVRKHYPQHPQNHRLDAGLHTHVSVKDEAFYRELATKEYHEFFYAAMETWGKGIGLKENHNFWSRWRGDNRFCNRTFNPSTQMKLKDKRDERRSGLNYCWAMHKTLEFRLLPMFESVEMAISGIRACLESVDAFLFLREKDMINGETLDVLRPQVPSPRVAVGARRPRFITADRLGRATVGTMNLGNVGRDAVENIWRQVTTTGRPRRD